MKETGKVWLVGAGPSDEGLFTLKGKQVLEQAQVVVYDRLVGQAILNMIPKEAKKIDVGKRAGNHTKSQWEINEILLKEAMDGQRVVRLKGGDPFLFGRGGEELELLVQHHIPFEIVPGVTSAISVPAYNGIPVTHREFTSSVHIITGHKRAGEEYDIDFEALVRTKGTLVFLMGVTALPDIMAGLLAGGIRPSMPAAVLQKGTSAGQKKIVATVETLEEEVKKKGIETPAIIVVGQVCALAEQFSWYEKLPLFGQKIMLTRPKNRSSRLADTLKQLGAEVVQIPSIETVPLTEELDLSPLKKLGEFDVIAFTSPYGVERFFELLREQKMDIRAMGTAKIAAIGPATAKELEQKGIFVDFLPETYDGTSLGRLLCEKCKQQSRILIPRAKIGSRQLVEEMKKNEAIHLVDWPIYDTVYENSSFVNPKEQIEDGVVTLVLFTSASTVRGFENMTEGLDYSSVTGVCIGQQTKQAADALGIRTVVSQEATIDSMVECVLELVGKGTRMK